MTPVQQKALKRAMQLCSAKEYCEFDIRSKFQSYNLTTEHSDELITILFKEGYLNHERYARAFVNDKIRFNKWGKIKLRQALLQKKITDHVIQNAIEEFDKQEYISLIDHELMKKYTNIKNTKSNETKQKLLRFGASRGYELDIIYPLVDKIVKID